MSKFNTQSKILTTKTTNLAGGSAYKLDERLELASILLTSFVQDQYYRKAEDTNKRLLELFAQLDDKKFAAQAAIYARNEYGMRSISHIIAGEIAHDVKGADWTKRFFEAVVRRPDDMTEILAYYMGTHGKPIPNSLKGGFGKAFAKFDEYQIAKYRSEGKDVSLVDVVNLVRPRPTPKNVEALRKLVNGELKSTDTWESKLSAAGKSEDKDTAKADAWRDLLQTRRIGYMALVRNLRNIIEQAPDMVEIACELLVDQKLISNSKILPFRFYSAYREMKKINAPGRVLSALSRALDISLSNLPQFDGKTLVVVDHSGSMDTPLNKDSDVTYIEIGNVLGAGLAKAQDADFIYFGTTAKYHSINPDDSTLTIIDQMGKLNGRGGLSVGYGTNFNAIFDVAKGKYDRIFIFSDMQGWVRNNVLRDSFNAYNKKNETDPFLYSIDLSGGGTTMFGQGKVATVAGFSEKLFDVIPMLEQDRNALVRVIESIEI